jgi:preprotein translocase subunit SecE
MGRVLQFFRDVKSELFKVVWPSRKDTLRYTALVIAFSVVVAIILGAADYGLLKLFEKLLNR